MAESPLQRDLAADYKLLLSWRFNRVEFIGLPSLKDNRDLTLEEIYVPLRFHWADNKKEIFYLPKALVKSPKLVVLGDPGSGKSTLVKLVTHAFGSREASSLRQRFGPLLPIPIILRDYRVREWQNYEDMLRAFIAQLDERIRNDISVEWLLSYLRCEEEGKKAILLIDGLDEVGSRANREHLRDKIIWPLLAAAPDSYAILTSRIIGYDEVRFGGILDLGKFETERRAELVEAERFNRGLSHLAHCHVAPFNEQDIEQFITRWYAAREPDPERRRTGIESLKFALQKNERVKVLAGNPSLLTLMALIHRVTAHLPSGRVKLYDKIVEAYLETIDRYRQLAQYPASLEEMKCWLARVGWEMQERRTAHSEEEGLDLLAPEEDVLTWLQAAIVEKRGDRKAAADEAQQFLKYVTHRSGLLIPRGQDAAGADLFVFVHLTFQEYFAAFYLRGLVWDFDQLAEKCAARVGQRHWHETLNVLFEMLAEMRGAGDKLFARLEQQANQPAQPHETEEELFPGLKERQARAGAAELFSALLLDDENGLSPQAQRAAACFALAAECDEVTSSSEVLENLRELPVARRDEWLRPLLIKRLQSDAPTTLKPIFFLAGDDLIEDWPQQIEKLIAERGHLDWSPQQVAVAMLIGSGKEEVVRWAGERLPVHYWLAPITWLNAEKNISLIELNLTLALNAHLHSPSHRLLAQLGLALAVAKPQVLRTIVMDRSQARSLARSVKRSLNQYLEWLVAKSLGRSLDRSLTRHADPTLIPSLDRYLNAGTSSPYLDMEQSKEAIDRLIIATADSEWLAFQPDRDDERAALAQRLRGWLDEADDHWTQLLVINNLLTLNAGTPELCARRNHLLDHALAQPGDFTFPAEVRPATARPNFHEEFTEAIRIIFLHEPGDPFLQPHWFDPNSPEARFFLSSPREFFAIAAEVLDPKGETELAKWRVAQ